MESVEPAVYRGGVLAGREAMNSSQRTKEVKFHTRFKHPPIVVVNTVIDLEGDWGTFYIRDIGDESFTVDTWYTSANAGGKTVYVDWVAVGELGS
jgi:hypothetical protein